MFQTIDTVMHTVEKENVKHLEAIRLFGSSLYDNRVETLYTAVRKVRWIRRYLVLRLWVAVVGCV